MRLILKLKLFLLFAFWSALCLALYLVIALVEAALEIGVGVAGATVGQGGAASGLMDLTGDIVQWGVGIIWVLGLLALWFVKKLLTSQQTRAATAGVAIKAATTAAPYVISKHPVGRAALLAKGPASRILASMLARNKRP